MEHVSNKEKAKEICNCSECTYKIEGDYCMCPKMASILLSMQWKDVQHAKEKQQWIEKAVDFISKRFYIGINNHVISKEDYYSLTELIRDFEQTMKGE